MGVKSFGTDVVDEIGRSELPLQWRRPYVSDTSKFALEGAVWLEFEMSVCGKKFANEFF